MPNHSKKNVKPRPLVVDLDGTLIKADLTFERLRKAALSPRSYKGLVDPLPPNKLALKLRLEESHDLSAASLPVNGDVLDLISRRHSEGGEIHLVSGSPQKSVEALSAMFPQISSATGSRDGVNLTGSQKLTYLRNRFPDGFDYVGDSKADIKIWREAAGAFTVTRKFKNHATVLGVSNPLSHLIRLLRPKHWVKNLLVFLPAFLESGRLDSQLASNWFLDSLFAFIVLSMAASATYILNDIIDLDRDRLHESKRHRPIASGDFSLPKSIVIFISLSIGSVLLALGLLGTWVAICIILYQVLGVLYSTVLKIKFVDVLVLAFLFDLRLILGMLSSGAAYSFWLLVFAFFGFLSLGFLKRYTEMLHVKNSSETRKGYAGGDEVSILIMGLGSALVAVNTFATFLDAKDLTQMPLSALLIPLLLLFFLMVWSRASRSRALQDPVVYVMQSPVLVTILVVFALLYLIVSRGLGQ